MKQVIPNYTFAPGAANAGTVTLTDFTSVNISRVLLIIDVTTNNVIYDLSTPGLGGTANNNVITLYANTSSLASTDKLSIFYDVGITDPDYQDPTYASTELSTFREEFNAALSTTLWTQTVGAGMSSAVSASALTVTAGTTANSAYSLVSKQSFTLPFRIQFTITIPTRIVNQTFQVGVENAAGTTLARWYFNGTTLNSGIIGSTSGGNTLTADTTVASPTTATPQVFEIDARADGVDFYTRVIDSSTSATSWGTRSRTALAPGEQYFIVIRVINGSTAPASSTTLVLDQITMQNMTKFVSEVSAGRGNTAASRSLPITVVNQPQLAAGSNRVGFTSGYGAWWDDTATALAANGTFTTTVRDLTATAANSPFNGTTFAQEFRVSAEADVGGTLYLEVSRDNTNWRRIKAVALAAASGTGTVFYGEIIHRPSTRYVRAVFINGTTAQTQFMLQSIAMST